MPASILYESPRSRKERINLIHLINEVILKYQGKILTGEDFSLLWELDYDQLADVYHNIKEQATQPESLSKH